MLSNNPIPPQSAAPVSGAPVPSAPSAGTGGQAQGPDPTVPDLSTADPIPNPIPVPNVQSSWWRFWERSTDERNQLEKDGSQSHNIRRIAAYGALLLATMMYIGAFVVLGVALGFIPTMVKIKELEWHILATMLVPLFTVPTVLIVGVLKVTTRTQDDVPQSVQEALGKMVEKVFDKLTD